MISKNRDKTKALIINQLEKYKQMKIIEKGILASGVAGTMHATYTFPTIAVLSNGDLLATCRVGSKKDSADETIEMYRSVDGGHIWSKGKQPFANTQVNGVHGSYKICYLTELDAGHLIAAFMWVDREAYPGKPLFNTETEGCLPMAILLSDSYDNGKTWTSLHVIPMPRDIGPPSLTNPIMKLKDGSLAMSIETNKQYLDSGKWYQRVVLFHSLDEGKTWEKPVTVSKDPEGRIFYWDLRTGVAPDGRIAVFSWTYDSEINKYLNLHRRISADAGQTWSQHEDLGFADQPSHPAILPDGRVVLAWVDRFGSQSIRVRLASEIDQPFNEETELILHKQEVAKSDTSNTGELLGEMSLWSFGLPYCEVLPDGDVMVVYYAGTEEKLDIHWVRIRAN